jgi:glutamine synthetase
MAKNPADALQLAKQTGVKVVDLKFVDLPGVWQHFSIPAEDLNEELFDEGIGFDGSSIRGFQSIHESDMLLVADPETVCVDPALEIPTNVGVLCIWSLASRMVVQLISESNRELTPVSSVC